MFEIEFDLGEYKVIYGCYGRNTWGYTLNPKLTYKDRLYKINGSFYPNYPQTWLSDLTTDIYIGDDRISKCAKGLSAHALSTLKPFHSFVADKGITFWQDEGQQIAVRRALKVLEDEMKVIIKLRNALNQVGESLGEMNIDDNNERELWQMRYHNTPSTGKIRDLLKRFNIDENDL